MSKFYYRDLATNWQNDYLTRQPKKKDALNAASIDGKVTILPDSNNRAITIETDNDVYLQSYDTLILKRNKKTGRVTKLWNDYTATTMKHINTFLGTNMCKKEWLAYQAQ